MDKRIVESVRVSIFTARWNRMLQYGHTVHSSLVLCSSMGRDGEAVLGSALWKVWAGADV